MNRRDCGDPQMPEPPAGCGENIEYLLVAEERILQAICGRAPLPQILNEICSALDLQIGNMVSVISLPEEGAAGLAAIVVNAAQFGLHLFFSAAISPANDQPLASMMLYASTPRSPSAGELHLIERAKCLAAIAIALHNEANQPTAGDPRANEATPARGVESSALLN